MKPLKLVWRVDPPPTGHYRSFYKRGWPTADYKGSNHIAVTLHCETDYMSSRVKTGDHGPITVRIADYSVPGASFKWRKLTKQFETLKDAKEAGFMALEQRPEFHPMGGDLS